VRRSIDADLAHAKGIQLEVRGDGRTYQLRLRQDGRFDGIAWRAEFQPETNWQTIRLDFDTFEPVFRGRPVVEAGPVVPSELRQLGFMVADKTPGVFTLDIRAIHFY
jgi:monofunctional biosynthetic peptidoglycan transglycosylase